jgi:glycosyltransferase involved in cell wall biosynthesis
MNAPSRDEPLRRIALLGNHLPRQCGIATFTTHLGDAIAATHSDIDCFVVAMNDGGNLYPYPPRVRFEITEGDPGSYRRAADFLNVNTVDLVCVQHEYGIFGGKAGGHLLPLLRELRMPIVTTLHTILGAPSPLQQSVLEDLADLSSRIVVMSEHGAQLLGEVYKVQADKIDIIPHGIPPIARAEGSKDRLGVAGQWVILTFGLLSPDKGIEYVIDALPAILERVPDCVYVVLGATHPHVKARDGESYRVMLEQRARRLGVDGRLIFHNRFVSQDELTEFLAAADIYVTPYLQPEQITSGTLAYAVGSGKAVVSTPYRYARELLADERGVLVPWRSAPALADAIIEILEHPEKREALSLRAAAHGQRMTWPAVATEYVASFMRARNEQTDRRRAAFRLQTLAERPAGLPEINLAHVRLMTDDTGILQHASFSLPRYDEGYCLDDNARALLLMARLEEAGVDDQEVVRALASRYLAFVAYAFNHELGRFRNFMSFSRNWLEACGSEDSHGRALWALGSVVGRATQPGRRSLAGDLFQVALPAALHFTSPRAWAFALLGIEEYLRAFHGDRDIQATGRVLAERLLGLLDRTSEDGWPWFEERVTYSNAHLPQALFMSGVWMERDDMRRAGAHALDWLMTLQRTKEGWFAPIGSNGFYQRDDEPATFDQQPVEAYGMVVACLDAQRVDGDPQWFARAETAFAWFLGHNQLQTPLYDSSTGGCRDALHIDRPNENQGAESTLAFLLSLVEMRAVDRPALTLAPEKVHTA